MTVVCQLWPGISPHGAEVPTSIWNLPYGTWRGFAAEADAYVKAMKEQGNS